MGRLTFIKAWTAGGRGRLSAGQADTKLRWRRNSRKSLPTWTRYGVSSIARAEPRCNIGRAKPRLGKRFGNLHRHPANTEVSLNGIVVARDGIEPPTPAFSGLQ